MPRIWISVCAVAALASLLVPPHVCCVRFAAVPSAKACCCCSGEGGESETSHPTPTRQAPCCQKPSPATQAERLPDLSEHALELTVPPSWVAIETPGILLPGTMASLRAAWPAGHATGKRAHLLLCRFNC